MNIDPRTPDFYMENIKIAIKSLIKSRKIKTLDELNEHLKNLISESEIGKRFNDFLHCEDPSVEQFSYESSDFSIEEKQILDTFFVFCICLSMIVGTPKNMEEFCLNILMNRPGLSSRAFFEEENGVLYANSESLLS